MQFEAWIERRGKALDTRTNLRQAERDLREADGDAEDARKSLSTALNAAGVKHAADADVDALRATAQMVLDRAAELKALRADVEDRRREVKTRERNFATASEQGSGLVCGLGRGMLDLLAGGGRRAPFARNRPGDPGRGRRSGAARSTGALRSSSVLIKMQDDQRDFAAELAAIAQPLDFAADNEAPLDLAHKITSCVQAARNARTMRSTKVQELEAARERQRELAEARANS